MDKGAVPIANQRGVVLFTSLLLLSLIMAVGVQAIVSTRSNFQISSNLKGENIAFYLSEAGIEWSKNELYETTVHPPAPLTAARAVSNGTFSISTISTVAVSPLISKSVIRSNGRLGFSSQMIQAELVKRYQLADSALAFRGNASGVSLAGASFTISGMDHDASTGQPIAGAQSYPGVTVSQAQFKDLLESELSPAQLANISGTDANGDVISLSENLPSEGIARLVDSLCAAPGAQVTQLTGESSTLVTDQSWGSRSVPELHCFNGSSASGDSVTLANSSGAGILVVRNANLVLDGTFHWEGMIVVTGDHVSLKTLGAENKEIIGALTINETGAYSETNPPALDFQGAALNIHFSRSAIENAAGVVSDSTLTDVYPYLPSEIVQSYWRLVTS